MRPYANDRRIDPATQHAGWQSAARSRRRAIEPDHQGRPGHDIALKIAALRLTNWRSTTRQKIKKASALAASSFCHARPGTLHVSV